MGGFLQGWDHLDRSTMCHQLSWIQNSGCEGWEHAVWLKPGKLWCVPGVCLESELQDQFGKRRENLTDREKSYYRIGLIFNSSKTPCVLCGSMQVLVRIGEDSDLMLHVQVQSLPLNSIMNDLGVLLHDRTIFAANPGSSETMMTEVLSYLSRKHRFFVEDATTLLVHSLILSRLNFVLLSGERWTKLWYWTFRRLNFVARPLFRIRKSDAVTPFMKTVNWSTVELLRAATACFMYKVANHMVSGTLALMFLTRLEVSERTTRQSNNFHVSMALTTP